MKKLINDLKSAKWAIIGIIAYFAFFKKHIYSICPAVLITGFPCPGCGMTRALLCVLRLDFKGAWSMHPFIYPIILLAVLFCFCRYIMENKGMKLLFALVIIIAVAMIAFYIWRMYMYFPGDAPMSYYYGSLFGQIKRIMK